ncbi:MAG: S1C family serine protease [Planctomycetaceae bacterium]|nr:serine protease [Planctomycetaceae bacterium]
MGQKSRKSQGNNNQVFLGAGIGLVVAGAAFALMSSGGGNNNPQAPGPIVQQESREVRDLAIPAVNTTTTLPPATLSSPSQPIASAPAPAVASNNSLSQEPLATATPAPNAPGMSAPTSTSGGPPSSEGSPDQPAPSTSSPLAGAPQPSAEELKLPDLIERAEPAVVRINTRSSDGYSVGSGFVVSSNGTVVTNYHVIEGAKEANVEFSDGTKAEVLGFKHYDAAYDIAIIQIAVPDKGLTVLPLADAPSKKGESVVAFGAPLGLSFTTTQGIISAIRSEEEMQGQMGLELKGTWLQTSTPISPGNSGGPLVNLFGSVVAMNTMQLTSGQNLNFAVSAQDVFNMLQEAESKPLEKLQPDKLKPIDRSMKRQLAKNIEGTERGNQLLAKVDEIWLILLYKNSSFDPTGRMRETVYSHAEQAVKKSNINLSFGEPSGDAAAMIVTMDMKMVRGGTLGTQEVVVEAFLIVEDPEEKSNNKLVKIWTVEEASIGTVALQAIAQGQFPRTMGTELTKLFNKFRTSRTRAERAIQP